MALKTRVLCFLFALFFVCLPLCSCAAHGVVSYGSQTLDDRLFSYALTLNKTQTLSKITGTSKDLTDDESIWSSTLSDGSTYADLVLSSTLKTMKMTLFYCDYAKKNNISLTEEERAAALENVTAIVDSFSSREAFDKYMSAYGFDYDLLCRYYLQDYLSQKGMRAYYKNPLTSLTQADVLRYYEEEYVTAAYLFVNTKVKTLPNGKTMLLTEEEISSARALFRNLEEQAQNGVPFSEFLSTAEVKCPFEGGLASTFLLSSVLPVNLNAALKEKDAGTLFSVEEEDGLYLVKKEEISQDFFNENLDALTLSLISVREEELLKEKDSDFFVDTAYFDSIDIATLAIF